MTVYVDDMYLHPIGQFHGMKMSHMIADTKEELFEMADEIGVARKWYQGDHFDISMSKRAHAVKAGAVQISYAMLGKMFYVRRRLGILPSPDSADMMYRRIDQIRALL